MKKNIEMDSDTKLAIREEVEQRLNSPPAVFAERIENEVEKRVEQRVKGYKVLAAVIAGCVAIFCVVLFNVSQSTIRNTVEKQLAEKEVTKAAKRILDIQATSESAAINVSNSIVLVKAHEEMFLNRLAVIKGADNVMLVEDIQKLFVIQTVTNLVEGNKIVLDYEPIPQTVMFAFRDSNNRVGVGFLGTLEGKTITLKMSGAASGIDKLVANPATRFNVEYVRKSPR